METGKLLNHGIVCLGLALAMTLGFIAGAAFEEEHYHQQVQHLEADLAIAEEANVTLELMYLSCARRLESYARDDLPALLEEVFDYMENEG